MIPLSFCRKSSKNKKGLKSASKDYTACLKRERTMDKVEENIKISEEQKEARCQQIRQQYGPQAASMTLDDCLSYAEATLKQEIMQREFEAIREEMRERITVDTNENFDKEAFLKSGIPAYNEMRKAGNCYDESMSTTPATEEKPEE